MEGDIVTTDVDNGLGHYLTTPLMLHLPPLLLVLLPY